MLASTRAVAMIAGGSVAVGTIALLTSIPNGMNYGRTYDTFIGITKEIVEVKTSIEVIEASLSMPEERQGLDSKEIREVKLDSKQIEAMKESIEERVYRSMQERAHLLEVSLPEIGERERQELYSRLNSLADSLINKIEAAVPGAIQAGSRDTPKGTEDYVHIDYEQIRSALGSLPNEYDVYLAEFFAGFERTSINTSK